MKHIFRPLSTLLVTAALAGCTTTQTQTQTTTSATTAAGKESSVAAQQNSPQVSLVTQAVATQNAPKVQVHSFKTLPLVGTAYFPKQFSYGQGGWSGASRVQTRPGVLVQDEIWTVNDRGLNLYLEAKDSRDNLKFSDGDRYFPVPQFNQTLFRIKLSPSGEGSIVEQISLMAQGAPTDGLPSSIPELATGEKPFEMKSPKGPFAKLASSPRGFDFEGVAQSFDQDGQREFWLVEEYGPSILRADARGNITKRWSPAKNHSALPLSLPWVIRQRSDNRGFEGVSVSGDYVLAALQSPLDAKGGPTGERGHGNKNTAIHRLIRIQRSTGLVEQFAYVHSESAIKAGGTHRDVKIGDLAALDESGNRFLVLEHSNARKHMALYEARITPKTTRLLDSNAHETGKAPYTPVETRLVADLAPLLVGLELPEKAEGVTLLDEKTVAIVFDNDHCIEPLLAGKSAPKECENLIVTIGFANPIFR
jgi:hypothetical protein